MQETYTITNSFLGFRKPKQIEPVGSELANVFALLPGKCLYLLGLCWAYIANGKPDGPI